MSRYRKIDPRIWNDKKFRDLSDSGKLLFFMLLTHPSMTALGAMRATLPGLAAEMGWTAEAFREASSKGMAEHDERACLVTLPNFLKYNPPESPNVVKAWAGSIDLLPECQLKTLVLQRAQGFAEGMTEGFRKAFREVFPKGMPNQEQEQEQKQEQEKATTPSGVVGASAGAQPPSGQSADVLPFTGKQRAAIPAVPDCPHEEIIELYHEVLPMCPAVRIWEDDRQKLLRSRWREDSERQNLAWWKGFFEYVKSCPFLIGQKDPSPDREPFLATLEWLVRPKNFAKVIEGNYRPRARA
ncbi:hypothetical protein [Lysobacter capsici]|uniref:hypothetical protein n=1 Tax=Lysobacter capsici TaxID=435897 RepID=UPI00071666BC|nr:hypothetical protein [Lysobacter capsici]